ncbi:MAG: hypothetical protein ABSH05_18440 [Bryobacteraceae bacterium]|jgi:hypothetical protein
MRILPIFFLSALLAADPPAAVDNSYIRVFQPVDPCKPGVQPRDPSLNRVVVHLALCDARIREKNGKDTARHSKYGEVEWKAAGDVTACESVTGKPCKVVEIEIKDDKGWTPVAAGPLDPLKVDPAHYQLLLENDQVRVLRAHFGPHETSAKHQHVRNRFTVMLTDADLRPKTEDGQVRVLTGKAGDLSWVEGGGPPHIEQNASDNPFEVIAIEIKAR